MELDFDVDEYLEALKAPTFKIGGRVYRGRIVSLDEWLPVWRAFQNLQQSGSEGLREFREALIRYCDLIFPRPMWHHLVPWKPRWVGERLVEFPPGIMIEAIKHLFRSQGAGMRMLEQEAAAVAGHAGPPSDTSSPDSYATTVPTPSGDPGPPGTG